ncbi:hypothetical protein BDW42DRAFT_174664 [Aspergillus taichungensis]|uniref:Secreted protein n=1 Tax=Aspergillus taichungensis TaxID=482145 RepID=A0A2J5HMT0_9EURO|nr:hypothetical protein BDW42DRAFT_174664 [Aspergillus taichungensis]
MPRWTPCLFLLVASLPPVCRSGDHESSRWLGFGSPNWMASTRPMRSETKDQTWVDPIKVRRQGTSIDRPLLQPVTLDRSVKFQAVRSPTDQCEHKLGHLQP